MNIRAKILIFILSSTIIVFIAAVGIVSVNNRKYTVETSKKMADLYAAESAHSAEVIFESDLSALHTLKSTFEELVSKGNYSDVVLKSILTKLHSVNPQHQSISMSWELAYIDNNWEFPYGRLRTTTLLNAGRINLDIDSLEIDGDEIEKDYYKFKIGELIEDIKDPYIDSYSDVDTGTTILVTTLSVALYKNRKFVGIVGIDASFDRFNSIAENKTPFKDSYIFILSNNGKLINHPNNSFEGELITDVLPEFSNIEILEKIKKEEEFSFTLENNQGDDQYISFYPIQIGKTKKPWAIGFVVPSKVIVNYAYENLKLSLLITLIGLILLALIITIVAELLSKPIKKTTKILHELEKGNIDVNLKLNINSNDEIGRMAQSVNNLIVSLNNTTKFAKQIGQGNLKVKYDIQGDNDALGMALIDMKKNLINAREQEEKRKKESEMLLWLQNGITEVNEILRIENEDIEKMSYRVLKYLISYLKAEQGGFYILNTDNKIELISAFAFNRKKQIESIIEIGEGLVGRCVKEQKTINISNLPDGYLYVVSGLGDASPKNLVITPLVFEGRVYGIIEIASFNKFEKYQISFLERVSERIASSISNLQKTNRTKELLKESQKQSKILDEKETEIENRMNALKFAQKEVELSELETAGLIDAISKTASIVQYDMRGNIINIDDHRLRHMGFTKEELIGRNQSEFAIEATENKLWFEKFWSDLNKGITRKRLFEFAKGKNNFIYEETYIPILNVDKEPYKVINFGIDITEVTNLKEELKKMKSI